MPPPEEYLGSGNRGSENADLRETGAPANPIGPPRPTAYNQTLNDPISRWPLDRSFKGSGASRRPARSSGLYDADIVSTLQFQRFDESTPE